MGNILAGCDGKRPRRPGGQRASVDLTGGCDAIVHFRELGEVSPGAIRGRRRRWLGGCDAIVHFGELGEVVLGCVRRRAWFLSVIFILAEHTRANLSHVGVTLASRSFRGKNTFGTMVIVGQSVTRRWTGCRAQFEHRHPPERNRSWVGGWEQIDSTVRPAQVSRSRTTVNRHVVSFTARRGGWRQTCYYPRQP